MKSKNKELLEWLDEKGELHNFLCEAVWARRKGNEDHLACEIKKDNPRISKIESIDCAFYWEKSISGGVFWLKKYESFNRYLDKLTRYL